MLYEDTLNHRIVQIICIRLEYLISYKNVPKMIQEKLKGN